MFLPGNVSTKKCFYQENIMPLLRNIRNQAKGFSQRIKDTTNHSDHSEIQIQWMVKKSGKVGNKRTKQIPTEFYISKELFKFPLKHFQRLIPSFLNQAVTTDILKFSQLYRKPLLHCSRTFVTTTNCLHCLLLLDRRASAQRKEAIFFCQDSFMGDKQNNKMPGRGSRQRLMNPAWP